MADETKELPQTTGTRIIRLAALERGVEVALACRMTYPTEVKSEEAAIEYAKRFEKYLIFGV